MSTTYRLRLCDSLLHLRRRRLCPFTEQQPIDVYTRDTSVSSESLGSNVGGFAPRKTRDCESEVTFAMARAPIEGAVRDSGEAGERFQARGEILRVSHDF